MKGEQMIEAIETHETQITKTVPIKMKVPFETGVWFGIGLLLAPIILALIIAIIGFIVMGIGYLY